MNQNKLLKFIEIAIKSIDNQSFIKMTLSSYKGAEPDLKNIYIKLVLIKNEPKLSFTYRYKTRDIVKNYPYSECEHKLFEFINVNNFTIVNLFTLDKIWQYSINKNSEITITFSENAKNEPNSLIHDKIKKRLIDPKSKYLEKLKITDVNGIIYKNTQDKYKQINHYIELLAPLLAKMASKAQIEVVDMGSGKGYLTFALYDYIKNNLHLATKVVGVEYREDLVNLCNEIAQESGFESLAFVQGSILEYTGTNFNVLIALHACDTATDDAIFKGIAANADLIVVAPCCHKQIRREMEKSKTKNEISFLTNYGIFLERQAEMVTDGMRALILEYFGYSVNIQQFISDTHTPKNVMITAIKNKKTDFINEKRKLEILEKLKTTKTYFGIAKHHLEALAGL